MRGHSLWRKVGLAGVTAAVAATSSMAAIAATTPSDPLHGLVAVGPVSGVNGFPVWYQDETTLNGKPLRLEPCLDPADQVCPMADLPPDTEAPVSFPDNFPEEFFYQLAGADLALPGGGSAVLTLGVEGAFANGAPKAGDQIVFGRVRVVVKGGVPDHTYTVRHPWGKDTFTLQADGSIRYVQDIGVSPGNFSPVLNTRIGSFLRWSATAPAAPAGYVGVFGTPHTITGGQVVDGKVQNSFSITDDANPAVTIAQTDLFDLQGRVAANSGVDAKQAVYNRDAAGNTTLEAYASSDANQAIVVRDLVETGTQRGFPQTNLVGDSFGNYYARLAVPGTTTPPRDVEVVNTGDAPEAVRTVHPVDRVTVNSARYSYAATSGDAGTLTVSAVSSDEFAPRTLRVLADGKLIGELVNGQQTFTNVAAPTSVTVISDAGGTTTVPVSTAGDLMLALKPQAVTPGTVEAKSGTPVVLDASASTGVIDTYEWVQTDGPTVTLTGANTKTATFTAPSVAGNLSFRLTVSGPSGVSEQFVTVAVTVVAPPADLDLASIPDNLQARRGTLFTMDASKVSGVTEWSWKQVSGPAVTLSGATTAKPSFTVPLAAVPALAAAGQPSPRAEAAQPIVLEVTAKAGTIVKTENRTITIEAPDTLTVTQAQFTTGKEWRIRGTSNVLAGQKITVVLDSSSSAPAKLIGTALVDAAGGWEVRVGANPAPAAARSVSIYSGMGGATLARAITIK